MEKQRKNFYRRHSPKCPTKHPEGSFSGESEERKKGWKRCSCPISVSGVFAGRFARKATRATDWEEALAIVAQWPEETVVGLAEAPPAAVEGRIAIHDAANSFMKHHRDSSRSTRRGYGYMMDRFKTYSAQLGYLAIDQWRAGDLRQFRDTWEVNKTTENRYMAILKTFFEYAVQGEWIKDNIARKVKRPRNRASQENEERIPFTDLELSRMFQSCASDYGKKDAWRYTVSGQDLSDFIAISTYTGLRISDVATFHIDRLQEDGQIRIRTIKRGLAGKVVYTWVPPWLQERIRGRAAKFGPYIFGTPPSENMDNVTDLWRRKLKRLWRLCGPWSHTPTPHRFRHTFARILLQMDGVGVREVAELLGDTEEVVRKHYAAWVTERQDRLTKILQDAFTDTPLPSNVVVFQKPKAG